MAVSITREDTVLASQLDRLRAPPPMRQALQERGGLVVHVANGVVALLDGTRLGDSLLANDLGLGRLLALCVRARDFRHHIVARGVNFGLGSVAIWDCLGWIVIGYWDVLLHLLVRRLFMEIKLALGLRLLLKFGMHIRDFGHFLGYQGAGTGLLGEASPGVLQLKLQLDSFTLSEVRVLVDLGPHSGCLLLLGRLLLGGLL